MTLEEFIAECVAEVARRQTEKEAEEAQREADFQELLQSVKVSLRSRIIAVIPQPLRQFVDYAGGRPKLEELQGYPETWTPSLFKVEAPGLRLIKFSTTAATPDGPLGIVDIRVDDVSFDFDWIGAVAAAVVVEEAEIK